MTEREKFLLAMLKLIGQYRDMNAVAVHLQSYIAEYGPLSEDAASEVRELLKETVH